MVRNRPGSAPLVHPSSPVPGPGSSITAHILPAIAGFAASNPQEAALEHQLTIIIGPVDGLHDEIHVMARMNIGSFEDENFPESVTGTLLNAPAQVFQTVQPGSDALVDLGGRTYRLTKLNSDGTFELHKYSGRVLSRPYRGA
jgi:hypothetical protein